MTLEHPGKQSLSSCNALTRTFDLLIGLTLVLLMLPVLLALFLLVRASSPGPALFRQQRVGERRREFEFYKFRTMVVGGDDSRHREQIAQEVDGQDTSVNGSWKLDGDTRITPLGAFLRRTSLDELPQLFNVIRGDMTLVGPRPCLPWEADLFPSRFQERFAVRPGLTGLWQITGRSTMGTLEMLELDVRYVQIRSHALDLKILLKTAPALLRDGSSR